MYTSAAALTRLLRVTGVFAHVGLFSAAITSMLISQESPRPMSSEVIMTNCCSASHSTKITDL